VGGVLREGVQVAHDGSWLSYSAHAQGRTTLEGGTQVLDEASAYNSHLVGSHLSGTALVHNSKLAETAVGDKAVVVEVFAPMAKGDNSNQVSITGGARVTMITLDRADGNVEIGGEANISGRVHGVAGNRPARVIGAGEYTTVESARTTWVNSEGYLVAADVPGVEPGTIGAQIVGSVHVEQDGSWAGKGSVLYNAKLVGSTVTDSHVSNSTFTDAVVSSCVAAKVTLVDWTADGMQLTESVLRHGESLGQDKDVHGLDQTHVNGVKRVSKVSIRNCELSHMNIEAANGPISLEDVMSGVPVSLTRSGNYTTQDVREAVDSQSLQLHPKTVAPNAVEAVSV
jgi:hypothetical protein